MMKRSILYIFSALLFAACSNDEAERVVSPDAYNITVAVCDAPSSPLARTTGDPGIDTDLTPPNYLYIWAQTTLENGQQRLFYQEITNAQSGWKRQNGPERWSRTQGIGLPSDVTLKPNSTVQVYIIAACNDLSSAIQSGINTALGITPDAGTKTGAIDLPAADVATKMEKLQNGELDLSAWCTTTDATRSTALGNLYSTPIALMGGGNSEAQAIGIEYALLQNGTYTVTDNAGGSPVFTEVHPTRLYHCAAKADFKWKVDETLRPGVAISTLTIKGLPTQLKVFQPAHNPAPSVAHPAYSCLLLAASNAVNPLDDGNRWIGREVAYVLQPPTTTAANDGMLTYDVTFTGRTPAEKNNAPDNLSAPATNPVFTTWYRVSADVE